MSEQITNISEYIAENFGANASYVEGLLSRYKSDPGSVDESWRTFFSELLSGQNPTSGENGQSAAAPSSAAVASETPKTNGAAQQTSTIQPAAHPSVAIGADTEVRPLTGAAKKIVENMETSLTVPTATTFRNMPVKVLEDHQRKSAGFGTRQGFVYAPDRVGDHQSRESLPGAQQRLRFC